jgi:hypothetical protein
MDVTSKVIFGLDPSEFRQGIQQVDAKLKETSKLLSNLGQLIGASFAGAAIKDFTMQAINLAAEAQNVQVAFANIGTSADLAKLQQATDGEISKLQLMERAVTAVGQGVGIEALSKQLEYANAISDATGKSFEEIADKLQTAFAKESTKGLEQVGINVKAMKEQLEAGVPYAEAFNAAMQATITQIGPGVASVADQLDRQKATIEDLKLQIGTALLPVYSGFLGFLAEGLKAVGNLLSGHLSLWQKLAYLASYAQGAAGAQTRIYLDGLKAAKESIEDVTLAAPKLGAGLGTAMDEATTKTKKATVAAEKYRDTLSGMLSLAQQFAQEDFNFVARGEVLGQFQPIDIEEISEVEGELVPLIAGVKDFSTQLQAATMIGQQFGSIITQSFTAAITNGEDFFQVLKKAVLDYVKQLAAAVAATLALSAIVSAFTGAPLGATFKAVSQGTGLGNLFGDGGMLNLNARLAGPDILLSNQRSGTNLSRIGG